MPNATDAVWLSVLPDMKGFGPALAKGASAEADKVGKDAGSRFGKAALAATAAIAAGGALAAKALYGIGSTFDDLSDKIRVGTGATGKQLDALVSSAKNVGKSVPASFDDIGTTVTELNKRLGLTGKPLEQMAGQLLEVSRITETDLSSNIKAATRVFGDWGIEVDQQSGALDKIFRASQATGAGFDQLAASATKFGGPMRQLGFSFDETLALLGRFEKEGVNSELVMGSMRIALGKMAQEGEKPVETLRRVMDSIKGAGSAGEANATALELFGARAGPDMAAAIREGRFEIDDLVKTIGGGDETIRKAGKQTADFSETWQLFKNQAMIALEPVATRVFSLLGTGMSWINANGIPALKGMAEWVQKNAAWLAPLGAAIGAVVVGMAAWTVATRAYAAAQAALNVVMAANPIGLVVLALVALGAALVVAYKKSDTFREIVDKAWAGVKQAVSAAWNGVIKPVLSALVSYFQNVVFPVYRSLWSNVVKPVFESVGGFIKSTWNNVIKPLLSAWKAYFTEVLFPAIRFLWNEVVRPVMTNVGEKIRDVWVNVIRPTFEALRDFITNKVQPAFKTGVEAIGRIWGGLRSAARKPVEFIVNTVYMKGIRPVINAIPGVGDLPSASFDRGGYTGPGHRLKPAGVVHAGEVVWSQADVAAWGGPQAVDSMRRTRPRGYASGGVVIPAPGSWNAHSGYGYPAYDINVPGSGDMGNPVRAWADGHVSFAGFITRADGSPSYGNTIVLAHPSGGSTLYAHLSRIGVGQGAGVSRGDLIGNVGSTGNSTGPHLHFEMRGSVPNFSGMAGVAAASNPLEKFKEAIEAAKAFASNIGGWTKKVAGMGMWGPMFSDAVRSVAGGARGWINDKIPGPGPIPDLFDNGGYLQPGGVGVNLTNRPEPVFTDAQWATLRHATTSTLAGARSGARSTALADQITAMHRDLHADLNELKLTTGVTGPERAATAFAAELNNEVATGMRRSF